MPYTKLDSGLIYSTVWREPHTTRIVWVTMLAMADRHGEVMASVPGLADASRVTRKECEAALRAFLAPDPDSRTPDYQGRRIEKIPGGWVLLNHAAHRGRGDSEDRLTKAAARQKRWRERQKASLDPTLDGFGIGDVKGDRNEKRYGGVTDNAPSQEITTSSKQSPATNSTTKATTVRVANANAPFVQAWGDRYGKGTGTAVAARLGKVLKRLRLIHEEGKILQQFTNYLMQTPPDFANPQSFEQRFGSWTGKRNGTAGRMESSAEAVKRGVEHVRGNR